METIKAIETEYKGYRFRSRLEARWAVFFDTLEIKWEYEKEGYTLADGTNYLPDFWIPLDDDIPEEYGHFIEIKAHQPNTKEMETLLKFSEKSWGGIYCFWDMTETDWRVSYFWRSLHKELIYDPKYIYLRPIDPSEHIVSFPFSFSFLFFPDFYKAKKLSDALKAARSARFEYGEKG